MSEPTVNINGTSLTEAQAMTLRVAITEFLTRMSNVGELGEDQTGEDIRQRYSARSTEIVGLMLSPAAPSLAIETEEMDRAWRTWIETSSCRTAVGHFAFAAGYAAAKDATPPPSSHVVPNALNAEPDGWICEDEFTLEAEQYDDWVAEGREPKPFFFAPPLATTEGK
jgi:hypothetical protein